MQKEMQLAQILSDLASLSPGVCDPAAALALVSARPTPPASSTAAAAAAGPAPGPATAALPAEHKDEAAAEEQDKDLQRARELVKLHYQVRERCRTGELAQGLAEARREVERALGG
ncbi:hypothetical protein G6514_005572 [Epicoccum nigrum]|nr:hypothetical protein G6514_005572 [Epicoccum nigrum]